MQASRMTEHRKSESGFGSVLDRTARLISLIFSPAVLIPGLIVLKTLTSSASRTWLWSGLLLVLGIGSPMLYIGFQVRQGVIDQFEMRDRRSRIRPLSLTLTLLILCLVIMWARAAPMDYLYLTAAGSFFLSLFLLITLAWKISGHTSAAAGFAGLIFGLWGGWTFPILLLPLFVAWSRIHLNRHSPAQTGAGLLLGSAAAFTILTFI